MAWQYEEDWVDWVNTRLRWQDRLIVADLGVGKGHTRAMNEQRREEIYRGHKDNPTSKDRKQRTDNIHQCQHERSSKSEMSNQLTLLVVPQRDGIWREPHAVCSGAKHAGLACTTTRQLTSLCVHGGLVGQMYYREDQEESVQYTRHMNRLQGERQNVTE